ncbi:VOC family protein [Kibdelosporangium philippinense]
MGRARLAEPTVVLNVVVELPVRDVSGTSGLFENVFGCTVLFTEDDFAGLGIGAWSGGRRIHLVTDERPSPVRLSLETVTEFDAIHARAVAAGVQIGQYPVVQPWGRREFVIALPDGHEVTVSGPL